MAEDRPGFLGRWARRKNDALQGRPLEEPAALAKPAPSATAGLAGVAPKSATEAPALTATPAAEIDKAPEKLLSLEDVKALTQDSDFKPFMARNVGPEVRNAAMKKLFADPHFNVMDGLDIYIDDYSKPDPIPASMLRQMVGAKLLKIFDDDEDDAGKKVPQGQQNSIAGDGASSQGAAEAQAGTAAGLCDNPDMPASQTVAQSLSCAEIAGPHFLPADPFSQSGPIDGSGASQHDHAHSHLRLQPDHAPSAPPAGRGAS
ncbi:MAG: hypothetical protein JWR60_3100 [Polaromonas sp.]|nr:hypothetical protein [Polaromonas sp.]